MGDNFGAELITAIDSAAADQAKIDLAMFQGDDDDRGRLYKKYMRPDDIFPRKAREIAFLGLDRMRPIRLLDLGAGAGQFCLLAEKLGHEAIALTAPRPPIFLSFARALGVTVVAQTLHPRRPLDVTGQFDLITASRITFAGGWRRDDWFAFLDRLGALLAPGGGLFFSFTYSGVSPSALARTTSEAEIADRQMHKEVLTGAGLREDRKGVFISQEWRTC